MSSTRPMDWTRRLFKLFHKARALIPRATIEHAENQAAQASRARRVDD